MHPHANKKLEFCPETNLTTPKDVRIQLFKVYELWMRDLSPEAAFLYSVLYAMSHQDTCVEITDLDHLSQIFGSDVFSISNFLIELYKKKYIGTTKPKIFQPLNNLIVVHDNHEAFETEILDAYHDLGQSTESATVFLEDFWGREECKFPERAPYSNPKIDKDIENKNCFYTVKREWVDDFGWRGAYVLAAIQFHSKPLRRAHVSYPLPWFAEKLGMSEDNLLLILKDLHDKLYIFVYENENRGPSSTKIVPHNCFKEHLRKSLLDSGRGSGWELPYAAPGKVQEACHAKRIKIAEEMKAVIKKAQKKVII